MRLSTMVVSAAIFGIATSAALAAAVTVFGPVGDEPTPEMLRSLLETLKVVRSISDRDARLNAYDHLVDTLAGKPPAAAAPDATQSLSTATGLNVAGDPDAAHAKAVCTVEDDKYLGVRWVASDQLLAPRTYWRLERALSTSRPAMTRLYVAYSAPSWAFLKKAADAQASPLEVVEIHRDVVDGGVIESVAVVLPEGYLETHTISGLDVKLWGEGGSIVLTCRESLVRGFLSRCLDESQLMPAAMPGAR